MAVTINTSDKDLYSTTKRNKNKHDNQQNK